MEKKKLKKDKLPGYPSYPANEDIYKKFKEEDLIDPDDLTSRKAQNLKPFEKNRKDFKDTHTGEDLDVPGSELDDKLEDIGDEDEENNYYSLGGDNHHNLEED
ncbi:MAG: hypothetical protein JSS63_09800 [Bacteroidetes bacterium]|nr:hypothetical protein [Bacteroidota bacterium]